MTALVSRFSRRLLASIGSVSLLVTIGCGEAAELPTAAELEPAEAMAAAGALAFRQVSLGQGYTCGTTTTDVAYCWGSGALGAGSQGFSTRPLAVAGGHAFREVSADSRFAACGVTTGDVAFCWGANHLGQVGDGTDVDRPRPRRVVGGLAFRQVSAGLLHTCGVTTDDVAYCWGHNQAGELGDGTTDQSHVPVPVAGNLAFRQVTAGDQFTCGVTTEDVLYCWGMNTLGELGVGSDVGPEACFTGDNFDACSRTPVRVMRGRGFVAVSAGWHHACALTADHVAFCWGDNLFGQLGRGTTTGPELCFGTVPCSTRPRRVLGGLAFASVDGGSSHTCGATTDGTGYCWGSNGSGELGIGNRSGPDTCFGATCNPDPVLVAGGHDFRSVSLGLRSSCGVTNANVAFCWGDNFEGQLGDGTTRNHSRPRRVLGPS